MKRAICLIILVMLLLPMFVLAQEETQSSVDRQNQEVIGQILKEQKDLKRILTTEIKQQTNDIKSHHEETLHKEAEILYNEVIKFKTALVLQLTIAIVAGMILGFILKEFLAIRLRRIRLALKRKEYEGYFAKYEKKKEELKKQLELIVENTNKGVEKGKKLIVELNKKITLLNDELKKKVTKIVEKRASTSTSKIPVSELDIDKIIAQFKGENSAPNEIPDLPSDLIGLELSNLTDRSSQLEANKPPTKHKRRCPWWILGGVSLGLLLIVLYFILRRWWLNG